MLLIAWEIADLWGEAAGVGVGGGRWVSTTTLRADRGESPLSFLLGVLMLDRKACSIGFISSELSTVKTIKAVNIYKQIKKIKRLLGLSTVSFRMSAKTKRTSCIP